MKTRGPEGFTLIEMLIALAIFGMLTAAGVTLLSLTARTQETSDRLLSEVGEIRRLGALMKADLAQAAARLYRDGDGRRQRAFAGGGGGEEMVMVMVRRGWNDGEGAGLQRVGYRFRDNQLERIAFDRVDGGGGGTAVRLVGGVRALRLRYRDRDGAWLERWTPSDGTRLPLAVEIVLESESQGLVRQLFVTGSGR